MAQPNGAHQQPQDVNDSSVLTTVDGRRLLPVLPPQAAVVSDGDTDIVIEKLAGNYTQDVIDEVRKYGKPQWEVTETSTLDPIDDIEDMYNYDFKLPPGIHDKYAEAAAGEIVDLEHMKGPVDPELLAKIEQRKKLVEGRHADDVKWMKHKAYYRGMQKVRAAKKQLEEAAAEDAADAAAVKLSQSAAVSGPSSKPQQQQQQQQKAAQQTLPQNHIFFYSENEVLAGISDPSEWDQGYLAPSYQQHPEVLQQLRSSFASCLGLPYVSPQQQQEQQQQMQQVLAVQEAAQQKAAELEAAKAAFLAKYTPYQAYTPEYLEQQRRQQQLAAHRRHKQQAFWLSLGLAVGSSAVRWWKARAKKQQQQQQLRRAGSVGGSSRRSTRPPTPVLMVQQAIAE